MRLIPDDLKKELEQDVFYQRCCITGDQGHIQWHHNLIFAGQQVNEKFCILPLLRSIHMDIVMYKGKCDWVMVNRMKEEDFDKYNKAIDYLGLKIRLNNRYGPYNPTW